MLLSQVVTFNNEVVWMTLIKRESSKRRITVDFIPEVMTVVSQAIYDGVFQTSNQSVNEEYLTKLGFTEVALEEYLTTLVKVRQGLVTGSLTGANRTIARNLYVPAGVAQMLVGLGEVEVGLYQIVPRELTSEEVSNINWKELQDFSDILIRMERILSVAKNILIPERSGDIDIMVLCVQEVEDRVTLTLHANADVLKSHPLKQAFALMAGIKLVNDQMDVCYPGEIPITDWRSTIYDAFSKKVDK